MQFVDEAHEGEIPSGDAHGHVVQRAAREVEQLRLARHRDLVIMIDHRFALGTSKRPSAFAKKSISNACWPILACNALRSGCLVALPLVSPKAPAALSISCVRH